MDRTVVFVTVWYVPVDLDSETQLDGEIRSWLAFARQKLQEVTTIGEALQHGRQAVDEQLTGNRQAIRSRRDSPRVHDPAVQRAVAALVGLPVQRKSPYPEHA